MTCSRVKDLLAEDKPAFGIWISLSDPAVIEMAALAGYDYVNLDMEHQTLDLPTLVNMLRTAEACGISAMVRVPENNPSQVLRVADQGPDGIIFPHIRDEHDARKAVGAAKFHPVGDRGISASTRAAGYGTADFLEFAHSVNDGLLVWLLIEEVSAVENIEAIAAVDGVDVCAPAPADLARAVGQLGSKNHPAVRQAIETVAGATLDAKKQLAIHLGHPNFEIGVPEIIELGGRLIDHGVTGPVLMRALQDRLRAARGTVPA